MKFPRSAAVLLAFVPAAFAQAPPKDAPAIDSAAVLRDLEAIEKTTTQNASNKRQTALNTLAAGLSNPADFFQKAVEATEFEGKPNKGAIFQDWKKAHGDLLKSADFRTAVSLALSYMMVSIRAKDSEKPEAVAAESLDYAKKLASIPASVTRHDAPKEQKDMLNESITGNIFTRWLGLQGLFPEKNWCEKPGDLDGILDKNIRSVMREKKDPNIVSTWDLQINLEAGRATDTRLDAQAVGFNKGRRPELLFLRAQDMIAVGMKNRGVTEMLAIVKANSQHPKFKEWAAAIRAQLGGDAATPAPTTSSFGETEAPVAPAPQDTSPQ